MATFIRDEVREVWTCCGEVSDWLDCPTHNEEGCYMLECPVCGNIDKDCEDN